LNPEVLLLEGEENILDGFNLKLVDIDIQTAKTYANS
jgi:hypothetical protein